MYYLAKNEPEFKLIKSFSNMEEFFDYIDNPQDFNKNMFIRSMTRAMEEIGGFVHFGKDKILFNPSFSLDTDESLYVNVGARAYRKELFRKFRESKINSIIE
jgi:hypothetical protein